MDRRDAQPIGPQTGAERLLAAEQRALALGVRTSASVVGREYEAHSQSVDDRKYTMRRERDGWRCDCAGYRYHGVCKHLGAIALRAEREGWDFGAVAGLTDGPPPAPRRLRPLEVA